MQVGTICAYPKFTPVPFKEADLWNGYPEETNAPYGIAKKALLVMCQAYREQYGLNAIYLLPVNLYGPRDNFDLHSSHVIPALIRKCVEARDRGDDADHRLGHRLGQPRVPVRRGLRRGARRRHGAIRHARADQPRQRPGDHASSDLTETRSPGYRLRGRIVWDTSKPDGQPRRCLDVTQAQQELGFRGPDDRWKTGCGRRSTGSKPPSRRSGRAGPEWPERRRTGPVAPPILRGFSAACRMIGR